MSSKPRLFSLRCTSSCRGKEENLTKLQEKLAENIIKSKNTFRPDSNRSHNNMGKGTEV